MESENKILHDSSKSFNLKMWIFNVFLNTNTMTKEKNEVEIPEIQSLYL